MRQTRTILICGISIFAVAAQSVELNFTNPYLAIAEHNVFGLLPPPKISSVDSAPPEIILNGIMVEFGRKYALFKAPGLPAKNYFLGEGERAGEIELLSVDVKTGTVEIRNHGVIQIVALAKPPALLGASANGRAGNLSAGQVNNEFTSDSPEKENSATASAPVSQNGYAVATGGNSNSSGDSGNNSSSNSGSQNSSSSNPDDSASPKPPPPEPWWVIGSRNVEASRIATAGLVEGGQAEPYPLTPFTPAGTPAELIGPGQLYFVPSAMAK